MSFLKHGMTMIVESWNTEEYLSLVSDGRVIRRFKETSWVLGVMVMDTYGEGEGGGRTGQSHQGGGIAACPC